MAVICPVHLLKSQLKNWFFFHVVCSVTEVFIKILQELIISTSHFFNTDFLVHNLHIHLREMFKFPGSQEVLFLIIVKQLYLSFILHLGHSMQFSLLLVANKSNIVAFTLITL